MWALPSPVTCSTKTKLSSGYESTPLSLKPLLGILKPFMNCPCDELAFIILKLLKRSTYITREAPGSLLRE